MSYYNDPAVSVLDVQPSDTQKLPFTPHSIYIGGDGDLAVEMPDGSTATHKSVPAGRDLPLRASKILATGTTATDLVIWR